MSMTRDQILQMNASARVYQERYDTAFEPWGVRVRAPVLGEDIHSYRRDLAVQTQAIASRWTRIEASPIPPPP